MAVVAKVNDFGARVNDPCYSVQGKFLCHTEVDVRRLGSNRPPHRLESEDVHSFERRK